MPITGTACRLSLRVAVSQERKTNNFWLLVSQSINQSFLGGLSSGTTAMSTGGSQLMSSKWSREDFLNSFVCAPQLPVFLAAIISK